MAWSKFLVDYEWGAPVLLMEEIIDPERLALDLGCGYQPVAGFDLTNEELQENVPTLIESSVAYLTSFKSDPRLTWMEDLTGW